MRTTFDARTYVRSFLVSIAMATKISYSSTRRRESRRGHRTRAAELLEDKGVYEVRELDGSVALDAVAGTFNSLYPSVRLAF